MAVARKAPKCYLCGESYKGIYSNRGKTFVGDSFIRWDTYGHKCKRKGMVYFIEDKTSLEWYSVMGQWTRDPLKAKFFKSKEQAEEWLSEKDSPFPDSEITEHIFV